MDNRLPPIPENAIQDGHMYWISEPNSKFCDRVLRPWNGTTDNGRGIVVAAPKCDISNLTIYTGDDDSIAIHNDCRGTNISNVDILTENYAKPGKGICLGSGVAPRLGAKEGFAATLTRCRTRVQYGGVRVKYGIYNLFDCDIWLSALSGIECGDGIMNLIDVRFYLMDKPAGAPYWYHRPSSPNPSLPPTPIRVYGINGDGSVHTQSSRFKTEIFAHNCTLDGQPVTAKQLCKMAGTFYPIADRHFRKEMITVCP